MAQLSSSRRRSEIPAQRRFRPSGTRSTRMRARRSLRAARWAADTELALRRNPPLRLAWRVEELVAPEEPARPRALSSARSFATPSPRYLAARVTGQPASRCGPRRSRSLRSPTGSRISSARVAARGVLLVERLLDRFRRPALRPRTRRRAAPSTSTRRSSAGATLMVELLGIVIAVLCFAPRSALIVLLDRV